MEKKDKVRFEEYDLEFSEENFENLSNKELEECKKIIREIEKKLEE